MTVAQVAARLQVPPRWVYRQIREGHLPRHKMGHYVRIDPDDLDAYLAASRTG